MNRDDLDAVIAEALRELLGFTDDDDVSIDSTKPLDELSVAGFELDSLDLLTVVLTIEARFGCEIDPNQEMPPGLTWDQFLDGVTQLPTGRGTPISGPRSVSIDGLD